MPDTGTHLSASVLYDSLPVLKAREIRDAVNAGLAPFGLSFDLAALRGAEILALSNSVLRIAITAEASPLPPSELAAALSHRFTRARPFDYASAVAGHRAALTVVAGDDRDVPQDDIPTDTLIVLTHAALAALMARTLARVVFWQPTGMLYLPGEIPTLRGIGFPVSLAIRPDILSARPDARGRAQSGILAAQSERYFGKPIRIEPTAHPLPDCLAVIDFCILRKLCGEDVLRDGTTLSLPGPLEVAIRHVAPDRDHPLGAISLTLRPPAPVIRQDLPDAAPFRARPTTSAPIARMSPRRAH